MPDPVKLVDPPNAHAPMADSPGTQQQFSQPWAAYNQQVSDLLNQLAATSGVGVTDGSDAQPGQIGEYMTMTGPAIGLVNNVTTPVVSLNLTAGDWDVSGNVLVKAGAGPHQAVNVGLDALDTWMVARFPSPGISQGLSTFTRRYSLSAAQVVELMATVSSTGPMTATGIIRARRAR